jgi:hypothetical protein
MRSKTKRVSLLAGLFLGLVCPLPTLADQLYEVGTDTSAAKILPASAIAGPHYKIRDKVVSDGFLYTYTIDSDFGTFQATGNYALQKIVNEVQVIAKLTEISRTEAFADSVLYAAKSPLRFGESMITDPVDTVTGIPKGLFSIFGNVAESVTSDANPSEDSRMKQALMVSSWKREYCADMGCDVYSSNKVLQEELNRIGWAAAIGGLSVSAATTAASGGAVMAFSLARTSDQLNEALRAEPPSRLRIINREKLQQLGVSDETIERFLDHPAYTPRHASVIAAALEKLKGVEGVGRFIELCLRAQDEVGANFYQNVAEILSGYHGKVARLKEIRPLLGIAAASASNGKVLVAVAWDYAVLDPAVAKRMDFGREEFQKAGLGQAYDIWGTGGASPLLKSEAQSRGFTISENVGRIIPITR